jgi:hypothetical protein
MGLFPNTHSAFEWPERRWHQPALPTTLARLALARSGKSQGKAPTTHHPHPRPYKSLMLQAPISNIPTTPAGKRKRLLLLPHAIVTNHQLVHMYKHYPYRVK